METEKRLIDASTISYHKSGFPKGDGFDSGLDWAFRYDIEKLPTVDAVEVVRCKDCLWARPKDHREPTDTPGELICQCAKHHYIPAPWGARMAVNADNFCSYGERRSDG